MVVEIRPSVPADASAIRQLHQKAFEGRLNEANLVDALSAAGQALISLVGAVNGQVVGHILFSPVTFQPNEVSAEAKEFRGVGLAPLAVLPNYQNQGIGSRLIGAGLTACREGGYEAVVVLGHPEFYLRFGFRNARDFGLGNEYGSDDAFMALFWDERGWIGPTGTVKFSSLFAATEC